MIIVTLTTTHLIDELPKNQIAIKDFNEISVEKIIDSKTTIWDSAPNIN